MFGLISYVSKSGTAKNQLDKGSAVRNRTHRQMARKANGEFESADLKIIGKSEHRVRKLLLTLHCQKQDKRSLKLMKPNKF